MTVLGGEVVYGDIDSGSNPDVVSVTPSASVKKLKGNKNELTITVTESLKGGSKMWLRKPL